MTSMVLTEGSQSGRRMICRVMSRDRGHVVHLFYTHGFTHALYGLLSMRRACTVIQSFHTKTKLVIICGCGVAGGIAMPTTITTTITATIATTTTAKTTITTITTTTTTSTTNSN